MEPLSNTNQQTNYLQEPPIMVSRRSRTVLQNHVQLVAHLHSFPISPITHNPALMCRQFEAFTLKEIYTFPLEPYPFSIRSVALLFTVIARQYHALSLLFMARVYVDDGRTGSAWSTWSWHSLPCPLAIYRMRWCASLWPPEYGGVIAIPICFSSRQGKETPVHDLLCAQIDYSGPSSG